MLNLDIEQPLLRILVHSGKLSLVLLVQLKLNLAHLVLLHTRLGWMLARVHLGRVALGVLLVWLVDAVDLGRPLLLDVGVHMRHGQVDAAQESLWLGGDRMGDVPSL